VTLRALAWSALGAGLAYLLFRVIDVASTFEFMLGRNWVDPALNATVVEVIQFRVEQAIRLSFPFLLLGVELAVVLDHALFVAVYRKRAAVRSDDSAETVTPYVTILIPAFDEPLDVLAATLRAAAAIDYPRERFAVLLLDDLGDPQRNTLIAELASASGGCNLQIHSRVTGGGSRRAFKAGNLNFGVASSPPATEHFLLLDADQVCLPSILRDLVPYTHAERFGFVQAPQTYRSALAADAAPLLIDAWDRPCREFHLVTQAYRAHHGATMLTGTNALISAAALRSIGGFDEHTVTEDIATGAELQARNFASAFHPAPVAHGLVPAALHDILRQRLRWAQGSFQLLLRAPRLAPRLGVARTLSYASGIAHFLVPSLTLAIALLPPAVLFFHINAALYYSSRAVLMLLVFAVLRHAAREAAYRKHVVERAASAYMSLVLAPVYLWGLCSVVVAAMAKRDLRFVTTPKGAPSTRAVRDRVFVVIFLVIAVLNASAVLAMSSRLLDAGYPLNSALFDYAGIFVLAAYFVVCGLSVLVFPTQTSVTGPPRAARP
jgi:cellulose synthase (UDP-forming)